jgi:hypothetical protein
MADAAFLRELSRARAATVAAEVRAEKAEEDERYAVRAAGKYRQLALRDAASVSLMAQALRKVERVQTDLAELARQIGHPHRAALEKAIADLAAAQSVADGDLPAEQYKKMLDDAAHRVDDEHTVLMAVARVRESQQNA